MTKRLTRGDYKEFASISDPKDLPASMSAEQRQEAIDIIRQHGSVSMNLVARGMTKKEAAETVLEAREQLGMNGPGVKCRRKGCQSRAADPKAAGWCYVHRGDDCEDPSIVEGYWCQPCFQAWVARAIDDGRLSDPEPISIEEMKAEIRGGKPLQ